MTAEHHFNYPSIGTIPLPPAWPQVDYLRTNDQPAAGPSRMQSFDFQPLFTDGIDVDLSALYCSPSAFMYQDAGYAGELKGESSGKTPP